MFIPLIRECHIYLIMHFCNSRMIIIPTYFVSWWEEVRVVFSKCPWVRDLLYESPIIYAEKFIFFQVTMQKFLFVNLRFYFYTLMILHSCNTLGIKSYLKSRDILIHDEEALSFGGNLSLKGREILANNCLMDAKFKEVDEGTYFIQWEFWTCIISAYDNLFLIWINIFMHRYFGNNKTKK